MAIDLSDRFVSVDDQAIDRVEAPATIEALRELVASGDESFLIVGGGTQLRFGNVGGPFDAAISTRKLNRVLHYEPADLTIAVEPGITVADLLGVLAEHNQTLAIDCPEPHHATIGGLFASGLGGPRRLRYGSLRDWILGAEVMDGSGTITSSGGMVVKNVTGYDISRLHYGAHGAFGLVTRLNLKVVPCDEAARSITISYTRCADAHAAGLAVLRSQLEPTSILVSRGDEWCLSVRCDGPKSSIDWQAQAIVDAALAGALSEVVTVQDDGAAALESFFKIANLAGSRSVARLSVPPSQQVDVLERYGDLPETEICADLGSGLAYVSGPASEAWRDELSRHPAVAFLALPADLKQGLDVFGSMPGPNAAIVRRLKDVYDPGRRFNRGRFALGL